MDYFRKQQEWLTKLDDKLSIFATRLSRLNPLESTQERVSYRGLRLENGLWGIAWNLEKKFISWTQIHAKLLKGNFNLLLVKNQCHFVFHLKLTWNARLIIVKIFNIVGTFAIVSEKLPELLERRVRHLLDDLSVLPGVTDVFAVQITTNDFFPHSFCIKLNPM